MATQIEKTTQSLTTAADMRETTKMLMQPKANWEEYLAPAPLSVAIMGELVFISSCGDFSINKNPPAGGFTYIKHPESFRACLMQICNSSWYAFNEAHKNMNEIRIHTSTIPDYMKTSVHILFNGTDEVVQSLLPIQLENISTIANRCLTLAGKVEEKFSEVINLIHELLVACTKAQRLYGEELKQVQMKLKESKLREQEAQDLKKQSSKAMEAMSEQVTEAQKAYKEAMNSLPSGWQMIGMDFVEGLASGVTGILSGFTSLLSGSAFRRRPAQPSTYQSYSAPNPDVMAQIKACSKSDVIMTLTRSLKEFVTQSEIDWNKLYDQQNQCMKTSLAVTQFKRISEELENMPQDELCHQALSLCKTGLTICEKLENYTPGEKWDEKRTKQMIEDITKVNEDALAFDAKSKKFLASPALHPKPPMMFRAESDSGYKRASQRASDNARVRIEESREQLKQAREEYKKRMEHMENNQAELMEILIQMQKCQIQEIDFHTTIKMLNQGLSAMGKVKVQWEKMVHFFQIVSSIIKTSLNVTMQDFVNTSRGVQGLSYNGKLFAKDLLYNQTFQASNIASLVHMISGTYTQVSSKYLMDRVSSLGMLMTMDKDDPQFLRERKQLQESCKEAQEGILRLVQENKEEFERKANERMLKIEGELKAILPPAPAQETMRITEIVQSVFKEDDYV